MITSNLVVLICWFRHRFLNDRSSPDDIDDLSLPTLGGPVTQARSLSHEIQFSQAFSGASNSQDDQWDSVRDGRNDAEDSMSQTSDSGSGSSKRQ